MGDAAAELLVFAVTEVTAWQPFRLLLRSRPRRKVDAVTSSDRVRRNANV
jgi:hypothetical protein